jgi:hypothetical protein
MIQVSNSKFSFRITLKERFSLALTAAAILTTPIATAEVLSSSPNDRFSVATIDNQIEIKDKETRASLALAPLDGGHDVKVFWARTSDRLLTSVAHGNGFELFGARLEGSTLTPVSVQDPGEALYNLIHEKLDIRVGTGKPEENYYTVASEELLGVNWSENKAIAKEVWTLFQNGGDDIKKFKFDVIYVFGGKLAEITDIQQANE